MKVFETWGHKQNVSKGTYKSKTKIKTFYGSETIGEQAKRFRFIHYFFKYKLFVPGVLLLRKALNKHIVKKVPSEPQFIYLKLFEEVFDKSLVDWNKIYMDNLYRNGKKHGKFNAETHSTKLLRNLKEILITMCMNDDAYAELIPFIMWNVYFKMHDLDKKGVKNHLLRNVTGKMNPTDEINYLALIRGESRYFINEVGKQKK